MKSNVIKNAGWIIVCRIIQSVISLIIGVITARYLGPSHYGVISYAASVVAFALPIMQLGLNQTLVKEFVQAPEQEGKVLGTSLVINILSGLACMVGSVSFVLVVDAGEPETILVCALYSLTLLFQATEMTQYWFQSKLLSKYPSIATLVAYAVVALYKVYLLVTQKSVIWFALSNVLAFFLISLILIVIYKKVGTQRLSFSWPLGKAMISRSKYYIIPGLMVMIFQHTDRVMIKLMIGEAETGFYSAAITCISISSFVFSAIIDSARPIILEAKDKNPALYEKRMVQLYSIITWLSLAQSVGMAVLSSFIVSLLYGEAYAPAAGILCVAVWYVTFSHYGSVRNIWILAEGKQKYLTAINGIGALANVALNVLLIGLWGPVGAALSSVIAQFFTNVVGGFVFKPIRYNNTLMIRGLHPAVAWTMIKSTRDSIFQHTKNKTSG